MLGLSTIQRDEVVSLAIILDNNKFYNTILCG